MTTLIQRLKYTFICSTCLLVWGCETKRDVDNNKEVAVDSTDPNDTVRVVRTGKTAEDRLAEMREWMSEKTSSGDTTGKDSSTTREEFKKRTAYLDDKVDSLSDKSRAEYQQLKSRYNTWAERQQKRQQQPLQPERVKNIQADLLREYKDLKSITPQNVREAYLLFMGTVRAKRQNWTQDDWDYVDLVYGRLNQRRNEIEGQISTGDRLKIKALQTEYLTLEGAADTKSMMNNMRN